MLIEGAGGVMAPVDDAHTGLDLMALLGHPVIGAFSAHKSGHDLNNRLVRELIADPAATEVVTFESEESAPLGIAGGARLSTA